VVLLSAVHPRLAEFDMPVAPFAGEGLVGAAGAGTGGSAAEAVLNDQVADVVEPPEFLATTLQ
jgi:hypothetical protein